MHLLANTPTGGLPHNTPADALTTLTITLAFLCVLWLLERGAPE